MSKQRAVAASRRLNTRAKPAALLLASTMFSALAFHAAQAQQVDAVQPQPSAQPASATDSNDIEAIVVTGSRIARSGFNTPTPVTVVGEERMEKLGVTNVADALNQIPSFRATTTPATQLYFSGTNIGARTLDLRGLGASRTLVLVDGRRFVSSNTQGTVDLNLIPSALVERTEVVTGGASAAYGSDAVAGVVNLILNKKMEGIRAQASYGVTEEGDGQNYQASLSGGTSLFGGAGHLVFGGEFEQNKGAGDCYSRDWCSKNYVLIGNTDRSNGLPATIQAPNGHASSMTHGGVINAAVGSPLRGIQFGPDGSPIPFIYGDYANSTYMQGGSGSNPYYEGILLSPPVKRYSLFGHMDVDLTDNLQWFLEGSFGSVTGRSIVAQPRDTALTIYQDNAYLPDSVRQTMIDNDIESFSLGRASNDLGFLKAYSKNETWRVTTGGSYDLGGGWKIDGYYQYGRNDTTARVYNNRVEANWRLATDAVYAPNGSIVCRSTLTDPTNGCQPFNVFGENNFSQEAADYVHGTSWQTRRLEQQVAALNLQGDLFQLPYGAVSIATGIEHREDKATGDADPISKAVGWYSSSGSEIDGKVKVTEGYLETVIPVLKDLPFAHSLELNGAVRRTHYNTSGSVTTWKVGAVYEPVETLRLRATRSRDIRAPNINELYSPPVQGQLPIYDREFNNRQTVVNLFTGGNTELKPETADTFTAGFVYQPRDGFLRGFNLSVDYYDIKINDAISTLGAQTLVDRCSAGVTEYCAFVHRNADTSLSSIDIQYLNLNTVKTNGVEIAANYRLGLDNIASSLNGNLDFTVNATYVAHLTTVDSSGLAVDRAGQTGWYVSAGPGVPHWLVDALVSYNNGPLSVTAEGRYIPSGTYDAGQIGPGQDGYDPSLSNSISDNHVSARAYLNLSGQYDIIQRDNTNVQIFASVSNVLNQDPPVAVRFNPILFDTLGRSYRFGIRVKY